MSEEVQDGVLQQLLTKTDTWDFSDPDQQESIIGTILDADYNARQIVVRIAEHEVRKASIEAEAKVRIAKIEAEAISDRTIKAAAAPYQWRKHLVWAAVIVGLTYMLLPYIPQLKGLIGGM